jgi:hypothetical protein
MDNAASSELVSFKAFRFPSETVLSVMDKSQPSFPNSRNLTSIGLSKFSIIFFYFDKHQLNFKFLFSCVKLNYIQ